ncbi:hypothetical protein HYH43_07025 [Clostridium botulinum]|uniref:hypothetical protein n=1 Tax=Clostridium botulinum TaxID=1491 RepID=UPI0007736382|nr:hypothetical protein [Clostridium botulinum]MBY6789189.1 hypothetical protein [Clostridium botulinum]MBY6948977.1 hypothetical protein [Clostridium botulinum]MBY7022903.1 hypothetical protein [Clostridium botulinum]NFI33312.1 hypothetical protein [Clostridium botulinum]NFL87453.1 hypothetical protein [Clostridium botulinum]
MDFQVYKQNIINKMILDTPNYLKQKLINEIRECGIGAYSNKDPEKLDLSHMSKSQKIELCVKNNNKTLQLIDFLELNKGYKYTILFKYNNLDFNKFVNKLNSNATNINSNYYKNYSNEVKETDCMFYETDKCVFVKFHKMIDIIDKKKIKKEYIRYPIVFIFYKDINIFECRFDRLSYKTDYSFYKLTMNTRLSELVPMGNFDYNFLNLESIIKDMVENKKEFIKEIIWSFEAAKSKGLTLKAGEDGIMPFIGELEIMLIKLKKENESNKEVLKCLRNIEDYLETTKRFANEKFRILSLIKFENNKKIEYFKNSIDFKILFGYSGNTFDLLNIYDNEINDMERIDYVIKFIGKVGKDLGEL